MPVENVIAQHQRTGITCYEAFPYMKCLRHASRVRLHSIREIDSPLCAAAQDLLEAWRVLRSGNHEDLPNTSKHERGKRVINQRFVIYRQKLFGNYMRYGIKTGARPAGQNYASQGTSR